VREVLESSTPAINNRVFSEYMESKTVRL